MNKRLWASILFLLILSGCIQPQTSSSDSAQESSSRSLRTESEESMTGNSESVAKEVGVNGMTEEEILELFMRKVNEANEIDSWIFYDCFEDFDENSEGIYDVDDMSPEGFHWHPSARFETRQALYDYMGTVFPARGVPNMLDWLFGEEVSGPDEDGNPVHTTVFKEIDGRLHVRDSGRWVDERPKNFDYPFETAVVAEETEGRIEVDVDVHSYPDGPRDRLTLLLENSNWVIVSIPTRLGLEPASSPGPEKDDAQ